MTARQIKELQEVKDQIRLQNPDLKSSTVERRALKQVGLEEGISAKEAESILAEDTTPNIDRVINEPRGKTRTRRAARGTARAGRSVQAKMKAGTAQKWIFGIMIMIVAIQLFNDIIQGRNRQFDVIPRRIFAGSLAGILLMLLAIIMPRVALGLALVMAATVLLVDARASGVLERLANVAKGEAGKVNIPDKAPEPKPVVPPNIPGSDIFN